MSHKIICFGEALCDRLPQGLVLGGAPLNVSVHCRQLGGTPLLWSSIGKDQMGDKIYHALDEWALDPQLLQRHDTWPTGIVNVSFTDDNEPSYDIQEGVAWDEIKIDDTVVKALKHADALYYGTLACRSAANRDSLLQALSMTKGLRVLDLNLRPPYVNWEWIEVLLKHSDALKLNLDELTELTNALSFKHTDSVTNKAQMILSEYEIKWIAITRGSLGTLWISADEVVEADSPIKQPGGDPVGAGDACVSALLTSLLRGDDPRDAVSFANQVGCYVASQVGATPKLPDILLP